MTATSKLVTLAVSCGFLFAGCGGDATEEVVDRQATTPSPSATAASNGAPAPTVTPTATPVRPPAAAPGRTKNPTPTLPPKKAASAGTTSSSTSAPKQTTDPYDYPSPTAAGPGAPNVPGPPSYGY